MSTRAVPVDVDEHDGDATCWCCGNEFPEDQLLRLGTHPEAAVCLRCSVYLVRQARIRLDALHPSPAARVRQVMDVGRQTVVQHGGHRLPIVGAALRWVGDHLP